MTPTQHTSANSKKKRKNDKKEHTRIKFMPFFALQNGNPHKIGSAATVVEMRKSFGRKLFLCWFWPHCKIDATANEFYCLAALELWRFCYKFYYFFMHNKD